MSVATGVPKRAAVGLVESGAACRARLSREGAFQVYIGERELVVPGKARLSVSGGAAASRPSAVVGAPALGPSCYGIPAPARAPRRNAATRAVLQGEKC